MKSTSRIDTSSTKEGREDQANYESLKTVGAILEKLGPRYFSMEQTFGLVQKAVFRRYFHLLLNDICRAGYNCRYKVENASNFQVPQERKRLLIIGAKYDVLNDV
jgi:DNA (cytosine-5)-methyltransferase 1